MDGRKGTMCGSAQALHFATVHFVAAGAEEAAQRIATLCNSNASPAPTSEL